MKEVLADIRDVDTTMHKKHAIVYYCGTVVIGKYWPDVIHNGAKFDVVYTEEYEFHEKAGVPYSKYWVTE